MSPDYIFCDGGVIGANPSAKGGTWAYCWVSHNGVMLKSESGVVLPDGSTQTNLKTANVSYVPTLKTISNNLTEFVAALKALESVDEDWSGTLFTDSKVTLHRITNGKSFKGIPEPMVELILAIRRARKYKVVLVAGHPTKKELLQGYRARNKLPTSAHNVWCDETCQKLAKEFMNDQK